jgi:hypothetical protein
VIDAAKTTIYVVAKTLNGDVRSFSLHALDIRTGNELLGGPTVIGGTAPQAQGPVTFNPLYQLQRPALLLENGLIYIGFGGNGCDLYTYNGWLFGYDAHTLQQKTIFVVTPDGKKGAIWQGGSGPAVDEFGNIYVATANGTYDGPAGGDDFGDSVLKMGWNGGTFGILDFFTPFNQLELAENDLDLGSGGVLVLPDQPGLYPHELVAGGKEGTLYLVNRDNEGGFNPDLDDVIQSIPGAVSDELAGSSSYWNGNVYVAGDLDYIKQFALINGTLTTLPVSQTAMQFKGTGPASTSISSNGNSNAILWALGHSNQKLFAFDATNLGHTLYDSTQAPGLRDKPGALIRFATPTVSNGKVYIGGKTALTVYGLLPSLVPVAGNNQSGSELEVLPIGLSIQARDAYFQTPIPGVSVTCKDGRAGGVFSPSATQVTGETGVATFTYKLPGKPQVVTIVCSNKYYLDATFTETVTIGAPARVSVVSGNNQTGSAGKPLPSPLVVKVVDARGFAVPGVAVTFTDNGAGGSFSPASPLTDSNGQATTSYTTGPGTGKVTITASTPGAKSVNFKETVQ